MAKCYTRYCYRRCRLEPKRYERTSAVRSASSYAKKYALGNLFLIDDTADSDATNDHGKKKFAPKKPTLTSTKDPAFAKAKDYVKAGGKVEAIKAKYALSKEVEQQLTTL